MLRNTPTSELPLTVLGIESSCDETAAAVVQRRADGSGIILANVVRSQWEEHRKYGGVVPELASRDHIRRLLPLTRQILKQAGLGLRDLDGIAYTRGPGLAGALLVGAGMARALRRANNVGRAFQQRFHLDGWISRDADEG